MEGLTEVKELIVLSLIFGRGGGIDGVEALEGVEVMREEGEEERREGGGEGGVGDEETLEEGIEAVSED